MTDLDALPAHWRQYAKEQSLADSESLDCDAFGRDELLDHMLDAIADGVTLSSEQIRCLKRNRTRKRWNHHCALVDLHSVSTGATAPPADEPVVIADRIAWVKRKTNGGDWELLELLAEGNSYATVADRVGVTVASLRSRVSRARIRIRHYAIAG